MAWPTAREFTFKALGQNAPSYSGKVKSVRLLGGTAVPFTQSPEGLSVTLPAGSECPVRFDTVSGDFDCCGVRTDVPGEPALRIRTVSGDVTLRGK